METAARGRSGVGRVENEAREPENRANGIGDYRELLVSSIGFSLTGKDDARAVVQVPLGSMCFARAAAGSQGGCTKGRVVSCVFAKKTHESYPPAAQKNPTLKGF